MGARRRFCPEQPTGPVSPAGIGCCGATRAGLRSGAGSAVGPRPRRTVRSRARIAAYGPQSTPTSWRTARGRARIAAYSPQSTPTSWRIVRGPLPVTRLLQLHRVADGVDHFLPAGTRHHLLHFAGGARAGQDDLALPGRHVRVAEQRLQPLPARRIRCRRR